MIAKRHSSWSGVLFDNVNETQLQKTELRMTRKYTCQLGRFIVVSILPIKRLTRATPKRAERARH